MDILNDILDTLDLKGVFYFRTDFSSPWSVKVPDFQQAARFHMVVQGQLNIGFDADTVVTLGPGDLILIPRGRSHTLFCTDGADAPDLETLIEDVGYDGNGVLVVGEGDESAKTKLVCGHFSFRNRADHPLLRSLPDYHVVTSSERAANQFFDDISRILIRQAYSDDVGYHATVIRLSEILFVELLRMGLNDNGFVKTSLSVFSDPQISKSIELIHANPESHWSVESLALAVGMSRSRFAKRFRELLDMGPMAYLSDWRLQKALAQLDGSRQSVQEIARKSGYQSPAAFTRAFTAKFDVSPTTYRQSAN